MNTPKLGKLVGDERQRDAVHIAIISCVAGDGLCPGEAVFRVQEGVAWGRVGMRGPGIGVVDPWLLEPVKTGERFWLLVNPGAVAELHHEWEHPAFPRKESAAAVLHDDDDDDDFAKADALRCREEGCWP